jgi:hypothetical protein
MCCPVKISRDLIYLVGFALPCIKKCLSVEFASHLGIEVGRGNNIGMGNCMSSQVGKFFDL